MRKLALCLKCHQPRHSKCSERTVSTVSAPVELDGENVLSERVLTLERKILIQNKNLSDIKNNCDLLLGNNS